MGCKAKENKMANKQAKKALEQFKQQAANEVGVNLNQGYNGDLTARQAGSIGGQMVKKMIESYEQGMGVSQNKQ
ncbi:MAG: alpha/beta-type small acid-soluble spore protein [Ruminococcaceae bacterium]|nr:alpha/beta-type small acid-soluble spore protein [Oscillospiraceae bacterium]